MPARVGAWCLAATGRLCCAMLCFAVLLRRYCCCSLACPHAPRPSQSDTSSHISRTLLLLTFAFPSLAAAAASPRAYPSAASPAQTSIPRPLTCCSPHVAAQLVSNLSLPSAALTAARFRHPPRSSVEPQPHRLSDSQIACIPAFPSGALQSCPRVLDIRTDVEGASRRGFEG